MRAEGWLVALALTLALPVRAQRGHPSLHWTRGEGASTCIDPLTLGERVEALTGPVFLEPRDYAIEGHVEARAGGWSLRLSVTDSDRSPRGQRVLEHVGEHCRDFDDAIVFLVALTIDPDLDLERLTRNPALEGREPGAVLLDELEREPPVPAQVKVVEAAPPPPIAAAPPRPYQWYGSASVQGAARALAEPAVGVSLDASFPVASWVELAAQLRVLSTVRKHALEAGYEARAQSFALAPLVCARPLAARWSVRACVGPEPSLLRGRGLGFTSGPRALLSLWGALAELELGYRVDERWAMLLEGFLRVNLETKRLVYTSSMGELREVDSLRRVSGGVGLGVAYRFGSGSAEVDATHGAEEPR